jgi:hypothetical protein
MLDVRSVVNRTAYMDFKEATDRLFERISHDDLADALGVSVASIRQARLAAASKAHRSAPQAWEGRVAELAKDRIASLEKLITALDAKGL